MLLVFSPPLWITTFFAVTIKRLDLTNNKHKPRITSAILKSVRRKNFLYKSWLNSKSDTGSQNTVYKNKLTSTIRNAKNVLF